MSKDENVLNSSGESKSIEKTIQGLNIILAIPSNIELCKIIDKGIKECDVTGLKASVIPEALPHFNSLQRSVLFDMLFDIIMVP